MAFLHHRSDAHVPSETTQANRGVVRGILPLELKGTVYKGRDCYFLDVTDKCANMMYPP